ncbi:oligosaccharide flippase family protein [Emcibacter sp.]|uniref:oligosaccharide flippase family protein n=1 Tax=Emcibacter sp. TaxID=1979954 RepID=UPI003A9339E8
MSQNRSLLKDISFNSLGEIGSRVPLTILEIVMARYLGPASYGIWSTIQLIVNYNNFIHFGFLSALAREEPVLIGQKDFEKADRIRNVVFTAVIAITILLGLFAIGGYALLKPEHPEWEEYGSYMLLIYILFICQQTFIFWQTTLQNRFHFLLLSIGKLVYSFGFLFLAVIAVMKWNIMGLILSWAASYFITIMFFMLREPRLIPRPAFDAGELRQLFLVGFPIFLFGISKLLISTIDKITLLSHLGTEQLGYYNVTAAFLAVTVLVAGLVSRVLAPHVMARVGEGNNTEELYSYFSTNSEKAVTYLSLTAGLLAITIQPFLWYILPEYSAGRYVGFILVFAGVLSGVTQFLSSYLIARQRQKKILQHTLASLLVTITAIYLLKSYVNTIEIYALGSALGWCCYVLLLIGEMLSTTFGSQRLFWKTTARILSPLLIMTAIAGICFAIQDMTNLGNIVKIAASYGFFSLMVLALSGVLGIKDDLRLVKSKLTK